jgi:hypothetical protein
LGGGGVCQGVGRGGGGEKWWRLGEGESVGNGLGFLAGILAPIPSF